MNELDKLTFTTHTVKIQTGKFDENNMTDLRLIQRFFGLASDLNRLSVEGNKRNLNFKISVDTHSIMNIKDGIEIKLMSVRTIPMVDIFKHQRPLMTDLEMLERIIRLTLQLSEMLTLIRVRNFEPSEAYEHMKRSLNKIIQDISDVDY